ncbi:MAG: PilZ domain-containing protein [Vicinamibacterales bacterium]
MFEIAVLIAAPEAQPVLTARLSSEVRQVLAFSDAEALRALQTITARKPRLVALDHAFIETPRGKALINRLKADPALSSVSIRTMDVNAPEVAAPSPEPEPPAAPDNTPAPPPPPELDFSGTRRAHRHPIDDGMEVLIDGKPGTLVNLSLVGAQITTGAALRPTQRVRLSFGDANATLRGTAVVVWANFEMPKGSGPRYRVGVDFVDPNTEALHAYIGRHAKDRG